MTEKQKKNYNQMVTILKSIAKSDSVSFLKKNHWEQYGCMDAEEAIIMSYENVQELAKA
jgi:hypothetical protein